MERKSPHFPYTIPRSITFSCASIIGVVGLVVSHRSGYEAHFFMEKVLLKQQKTILFLDTDKIIAVQVEDYVCKCLLENSVINYAISLREFEQKLPDFFIKISRNCLINSQKIESIDLQKREIKINNHIFCISCRSLTKIRRFFDKN